MARSTELWSEYTSTKSATGWTASRGWLVTDANTDEEARTAPPLEGSGSKPIAQIDESHPENKLLQCNDLPVSPGEGPRTRIVRASYAIPSNGSWADWTQNPLAKPAEVFVELIASNNEVESEPGIPVLNGGKYVRGSPLPVTNSALDPFDPLPSRDFYDVQVTITRNEPFFPLAKSMLFNDVVCDGRFEIPQVGFVEDGQCLCRPMRMGNAVTDRSTYVPVIYTLIARRDGWRDRRLDKGTQGWYLNGSTPTKGRFKDAFGIITEPVLLNGKGKPLDPNIRVASGLDSDAAPVESPRQLPPDYLEVTEYGVFVKYNKFLKIRFDGLL